MYRPLILSPWTTAKAQQYSFNFPPKRAWPSSTLRICHQVKLVPYFRPPLTQKTIATCWMLRGFRIMRRSLRHFDTMSPHLSSAEPSCIHSNFKFGFCSFPLFVADAFSTRQGSKGKAPFMSHRVAKHRSQTLTLRFETHAVPFSKFPLGDPNNISAGFGSNATKQNQIYIETNHLIMIIWNEVCSTEWTHRKHERHRFFFSLACSQDFFIAWMWKLFKSSWKTSEALS